MPSSTGDWDPPLSTGWKIFILSNKKIFYDLNIKKKKKEHMQYMKEYIGVIQFNSVRETNTLYLDRVYTHNFWIYL